MGIKEKLEYQISIYKEYIKEFKLDSNKYSDHIKDEDKIIYTDTKIEVYQSVIDDLETMLN